MRTSLRVLVLPAIGQKKPSADIDNRERHVTATQESSPKTWPYAIVAVAGQA
ncbi:MAG: hypothetical protein ABWY94_02765 [Pseudoxanthomonas sp.]